MRRESTVNEKRASEVGRKRVSAVWMWLAVGSMVALVVGGVGVVVWQGADVASDFPTGTFVSDGHEAVEFNEDGTCRWYSETQGWQVPCRYAVNGDLFTEMTFVWPDGAQVPATYYWTYDGEHLTFELWGEDMRPHRNEVYEHRTLTKID